VHDEAVALLAARLGREVERALQERQRVPHLLHQVLPVQRHAAPRLEFFPFLFPLFLSFPFFSGAQECRGTPRAAPRKADALAGLRPGKPIISLGVAPGTAVSRGVAPCPASVSLGVAPGTAVSLGVAPCPASVSLGVAPGTAVSLGVAPGTASVFLRPRAVPWVGSRFFPRPRRASCMQRMSSMRALNWLSSTWSRSNSSSARCLASIHKRNSFFP